MRILVRYPSESRPVIGQINFAIVEGGWQYEPVYNDPETGETQPFGVCPSEEAARRLLIAYHLSRETRRAQAGYEAAIRAELNALAKARMLKVGEANWEWLRDREAELEDAQLALSE